MIWNRRKFTRGLMAFILCGLLVMALSAFSCNSGGDSSGGNSAAKQKAAALVQAKRAERLFPLLIPLIAKNNEALRAKLLRFNDQAKEITALIEADNATALVPLLADLLPNTHALITEHAGDSIGVQLLLAGLDEVFSYFADRFNSMEMTGVPARTAIKGNGPAAAILHFRDGSHLRFRDRKSGKFVSVEFAEAHQGDVFVEKTAPRK